MVPESRMSLLVLLTDILLIILCIIILFDAMYQKIIPNYYR